MQPTSTPSPSTSSRPLRPHELRNLLRALRDVNSTGRLMLRENLPITIEGCLSLDGPVENGVRYRLRLADGSQRLLSIRAGECALEIAVHETQRGNIERAYVAELVCDEAGRTVAPGLRARWECGSAHPRITEHFLRRLVRGVFAA